MLRLGRDLFRAGTAALLLGLSACGGGEPNQPGENDYTITSGPGDGQQALAGAALPEPLVVIVTDAEGDPVSGVAISWATPHGGSFSATSNTDAQGRARATWTLGPAAGEQTATAALSGASGSPVTFSATASAPAGAVTVTGVSPDPMVIGETATISGTGFGTSTTGLTVTIDGAPATVTAVTPTAITVTVPNVCRPAGTSDVQVALNGSTSNTLAAPITPAQFVSVAVGEQEVLQSPTPFCLQFEAGTENADYLIGVQSTSEAVSSLTPISVTAVAGGAAVPPLGTAGLQARMAAALQPRAAVRGAESRARERLRAHRIAEQRIRAAEDELVRRGLRPARAATMNGRASLSAAAVPGTVEVGDVVRMSVPSYVTGAGCTAIPIDAVVRAVGERGIWLEDTSNPANGYTADDFASMSAQLDDAIYDGVVDHFGPPTDLDGNGRIQVLITKETNRMGGVLGFVSTTDLFDPTVCASSNVGETFYGAAPDPTGIYALGEYPRDAAAAQAPFLIAHEFTHIIQQSRRLVVHGQPQSMARWTAEGQATLAEEVVGFLIEGHTSGANLGFAPAFNEDDPESTDWYSDRFVDLATYFGYSGTPTKTPGAPAACSWLDQAPANTGPCIGGRDVYGTPWSLLRYLSDQYGPTFTGGEAGLQQAIIDGSGVGYANLEEVVNVPIETLLARWSAMLYMDDRTTTVHPSLRMSTWNLFDIFDAHLTPTAHLVPTSRGFGSFTETASVRAGSTAYFRVSGGTGRPATAVGISGTGGAALPAHMQVYVVRIR